MEFVAGGTEIKNRPDSVKCNSREDFDITSIDDEKTEFGKGWEKETLDGKDEFGNCLCQTRNVGIQRIAIAQICLAVTSIIISASMLACSTCETGNSAGSGLWCPVFFLLLGAMCLNVKEKACSSKTICIFGVTASYFALLLFAIKILELTYMLKRNPIPVLPFVLHFIICAIAILEGFLIIVMIYLHVKLDERAKDAYKALMITVEDEKKGKILQDETANRV